MMTLYKNINSLEMKTVGAVVFIFLLLLIAGVEPNPGPADMLVFRYQCLLIEVATTLLRRLFDIKVNNDFMQYLKTNPYLANKLNVLINNDIITEDQKKLLPPQDNNPNTENFDITLLVCLLRNICGLKTHRDPVWQKPANGDLSVEAEITRVKECRNYVVHKGTVYISESDFNLKWKTLCQILYRLNNFCGVPNLTEMIDNVYIKPLDDQVKQQHDNTLKAWHEAESLFEKGIVDINIRQSEIKIAQSVLKDGQSEIKVAQSELKKGQSEIIVTQSELKKGQSEIKVAQSELKDGQSEIKVAQSKLKDGQSEIKVAQSELKDGQSEIIVAQSELKDGQSEIIVSQYELKDGQSEIIVSQSELMDGQSDIKVMQSQLKDRQSDIKVTQSELMDGQSKLKDGQSEIKVTQSELKDGQSKIKVAQSKLKDGQSEIFVAQSELKDGQSEMIVSQSELMDGQSGIKVMQSQLKDGQSDIKAMQSELKDGQSKIKVTQSELMDGQSKIKVTLSKLKGGLSEIKGTQSKLNDSQSQLMDGQSEIKVTQSELKDGQSEIKRALSDHSKILQDVQEQAKRRSDTFEKANNSLNCIKSYTNDDVKERLQKSYETSFHTLCVTPLFSEDDRMDMLTIYTRPEMKHMPYHRARQSEGNYEISSYEQVFCETNTAFRNIFVTGDAGMGKTSFGQFMSLLWSKAIAGEIVGNERIRKDARFMTNFDFVFHVSLKETNREDVVSMIIDKYFYSSSKNEFEETTKKIEHILRTQNCLVILDGLDEWRPDMGGNRNHSLPRKVMSDRCTYLTTCRPYVIETVRLSEMDIDHQVQITGFDHERYIRKVIGYINKSQNTDKHPVDFLRQIKKCGMDNQLRIPLITSQLIVVWFKHEISSMSKAMIYGNIVEMLFERAIIKNQITFPLMTPTDVQFPESFLRFTYLRKYVSSLEKVCLLSFLLLFDSNKETPNLVFTKKQLMSEPYNISPEEIEFLCQLGIISKHKIIASFGEQEHMLSFLHQSYLEFHAAIFVSFFDKTSLFSERMRAISISDIKNYENFLVLLSGISSQMTRLFFEIIYTERKDQMDVLRREYFASYHYTRLFYSIQQIILSCFKEISVSDKSQSVMKLEDFEIDDFRENKFDLKHLQTLLGMNKYNVKMLSTDHYLDECTTIKGLQYLQYNANRNNNVYDDRFTDLMLQNNSTLQSIKFVGLKVLSELPLRRLPYLTSIHFNGMGIYHTILHDLINYISSNILLEYIFLQFVKCLGHNECNLALNLSQHSKLNTLHLDIIYIECRGINTSSLSLLSVGRYAYGFLPLWNRVPILIDPARIIKDSKLKHLSVSGESIPQSEVSHFINTMSSLLYIEDLILASFRIPDDASLQLHPNTDCNQSISVNLVKVKMSEKCLHNFIQSIRKNQSMVKVRMYGCDVQFNPMSHPDLRSLVNSLEHMLQYIQKIPSLRITDVDCDELCFESIK